MKTQLYLIRHGETMWNRERRIQGHRNIPLSPEGIRQAERLAQHLRSVPLDALYSSDLDRARLTAERVAEKHQLPVIPLRELRERHFGEWEGLTLEEIQKNHPDDWKEIWRDGGRYGIESYAETRQRLLEQLQRLVERHPGQTIGVVSHGGCINAVLDAVSRGEHGPGRTRLHNTGITHLVFHREAGWRLMYVNRIDHLNETDGETRTTTAPRAISRKS